MDSLTDEIPNQLSLEQDCHGSSSVKPGQYKKNKVYASRRFPPQCGTNAEPIPPEALLDMIECIDDRVKKTGSDTLEGRKSECRVDMHKADWRHKHRVVAKISTGMFKSRVLAARDEELQEDSPIRHRNHITVNLPPYAGASSSHTSAPDKVRDTLRLFHTIYRELREKAESGKSEKIKRIDLQAMKILKLEGVELNTYRKFVGSVPGVEVGDEYQYRVELIIAGVHRNYQAGIDYTNLKGKVIATSVVSSGAYDDGWDTTDVLIYSGQGENLLGRKREPEDQKLKRGNLAFKNSVETKNPVCVIRGSKERYSLVYDGLFTEVVGRRNQSP